MTGLNLPTLDLDPEVDQWDRQPTETTRRHGQFCVYRDLGRPRTLRKVAETLALNDRYVRAVAAAYRWVERAEAWDRNRDELDERTWLEERRRAAQNDSKILGAAIGKVADRLRTLKVDDLSPEAMIRLMDVALRHRRALFGDPQATIALTGPGGDPLTVQLAEFAVMSSQERRRAILELTDAVRRRAAAAAGADDDDDDPD